MIAPGWTRYVTGVIPRTRTEASLPAPSSRPQAATDVPNQAAAYSAADAARPSAARRWIAYGLPIGVVLVLVTIWFQGGGYLASGDVGPLVRGSLMHELGLLWNHQDSGAGSPSYETADRLLEVLCVVAARTLGLPAFAGQWLLYAGILAALAASVSGLCAVWLRNPWAIAFGGVASVVNIFTLINLLNPLPALALADIALLGGLVLRTARGTISRARAAVLLTLATLPLSYLGLNPPLLAVVAVGVLALLAFSGPLTGGSTRAAVSAVALAAPLALAAGAWWLVPEVAALHGGGGASFAAQTDVEAWTWTMQRASLPNVLSLNAQWGWAFTEYTPWAPSMDALPWSAVRWSLPLLALAGFCAPPGDRRTRRALRALGLAVAPLAFLCKGLHPPLVGINLLIYRDVPGMWLFREPMAKFGDILVLLYALLAAAALEQFLRRGFAIGFARGRIQSFSLPKSTAAVAVLAVAALCYPWPLWTSAVVSEPRDALPSAQVHIPAGWQGIADTINQAPGDGKLLELPLDTYYQVTTTWGYHGVDDVPQQLIRRPVLQELPGGYFGATPQLEATLNATQTAVLTGNGPAARNLLDALGATFVLVRRDLKRLPGDERQPAASRLSAGLAGVPGLRRIASGPLADVFEITPGPAGAAPGNGGAVSLATSLDARYGDEPDQFAADLAARAPGSLLTDDPASPVDSATVTLDNPATTSVDLADAGRYELTRGSTDAAYLAQIQDTRHGPELVLRDAYQITAAGRPLPGPGPVVIPLASRAPRHAGPAGPGSVSDWALSVRSGRAAGLPGGDSHPLRLEPGTPVELSPGDHVTAYAILGGPSDPSYVPAGDATVPATKPAAQQLTLPAGRMPIAFASRESQSVPDFGAQVGDCDRQDSRSAAAVGISSREAPAGTFTLTAAAHTACVFAPFTAGDVGPAYELEFEYRTAAGFPARYCVWEDGPNRCAVGPSLGASTSWQTLSTVIHPDPGTTRLRLYLYADGQPNPVTSVQYRAIRAKRSIPAVVSVRPLTSASRAAMAALTWNGPRSGAYQVSLTNVQSRAVVSLDESYDPRWAVRGLPSGWTARHIRANGYANAWIITGRGSARLDIEFGPDASVRYAHWLSSAAVAMCLLLLAFPVVRRLRRRPRPGSPPPP